MESKGSKLLSKVLVFEPDLTLCMLREDSLPGDCGLEGLLVRKLIMLRRKEGLALIFAINTGATRCSAHLAQS